jgi:hypothetical protein
VLLCAVQPLSPLEVSVSTTTLIGSALLLEECFFLRPGHVQHLQNTVQRGQARVRLLKPINTFSATSIETPTFQGVTYDLAVRPPQSTFL